MKFRRAFRLFGRSEASIGREVDEELAFHLEERAAELRAAGVDEAEALERARTEMGDVGEVRRALVVLTERRRRREGWTMKLEGWMQDLRYATRTLRRSPGYALTVVLTLTLGIGATTAVFSVMNPFFFRPLPFPEADRLIQLGHVNTEAGFVWSRFSLPQIADYRARVGSAEAIGHYYYGSYNLTDGDRPERGTGGVVSTNTFGEVLRAEPLLGRSFQPDDVLPDAPAVVLLDHRLWTSRYAGDPEIVGRTIRIDGAPHEVIGVMPDGVVFPFGGVRFWLPDRSVDSNRGNQGRLMIARLARGVDRAEGISEFRAVHASLAAAYPDVDGRWDGLHGAPLREALNFIWDLLRLSFTAFLGAVVGVLLIACVNVTGITLARTQSRIRELGVRSSLGAGRGRLVRQLVSESVLLSLVGGALGTLAAVVMTGGLGDILPEDIYRVGDPTLDPRVLLFALAVTAAAPLVFGLWPALAVSRRDLAALVREGTVRSGQTRGARRLRRALVVGEVAVGVSLIAVTGLFLQSARSAADADIGFEPERMLVATATLPSFDYSTDVEVGAFWDAARDRVGETPGVEAAGVVFPLLLNNELFATGMGVPGDGAIPSERPRVLRLWASEGYFEAAGIRLVAGRTLTAADTAGDISGVVVTESIAERLWPSGDPLGRTIELGGDEPSPYRVVGVVTDQAHDGIDGTPDALVYFPIAEYAGRRRFLIARSDGDPLGLSRPVREAIASVDPALPVDLQAMDELVFQATFQWSAGSGVLAIFGLIALLLASIGVYGIVAHSVEERRHEMAVRMSLGADASRVGRRVIGDSLALTGWGVAAGLVLSFLAARAASAILYDGGGADPIVLATAGALFVAVGAAAALIPARRASRIEPVSLLRAD